MEALTLLGTGRMKVGYLQVINNPPTDYVLTTQAKRVTVHLRNLGGTTLTKWPTVVSPIIRQTDTTAP